MEKKSKIELTDYQKKLVGEFLEAARRLINANVCSFPCVHSGDIYFFNGMEVNSIWIGEEADECPIEVPFVIEQSEIESLGGERCDYHKVFCNHSYPEDTVFVEIK